MKKAGLGIVVAVVVAVLVVGVAAALPPNPAAGNGPAAAGKAVPALDNGVAAGPPEDVRFPQPPEGQLTKIIFIRYAPGFPKAKPCDLDGICEPGEKGKCPDCTGGDDPEPTPAATCYAFLSGAQPDWSRVEDYYVDNASLATQAASAVSTWEGATSAEIFGAARSGAGAWGVYDSKNSLSFGDYSEEGVLGITAIWYRAHTIYEYDIMLDTDFFGTDGSGSFDFATVVLHEFGHAAGLGDLYEGSCSDQVMYGYVSPGEIRTTLRDGDIAGIRVLYGP